MIKQKHVFTFHKLISIGRDHVHTHRNLCIPIQQILRKNNQKQNNLHLKIYQQISSLNLLMRSILKYRSQPRMVSLKNERPRNKE